MRGEERRALILAQSIKVFAEYGYAQASIGDLARACGVTEPMLYKHFGSKHKLFLVVVEVAGTRFFERFRERVLARAQQGPGVALESLVLDYRAAVMTESDSMRALLGAILESTDPEVLQKLQMHSQELYDLVYDLLQQAQQQQIIPPERDLAAASWGFMSFLFALQMRAKLQLIDQFSEATLVETNRLWWLAVRAG